MQTEIRYGTRFRRQYLKADKEIKTAFAETLEMFLEDLNHPSLRNHQLKEKFTGYRSIDITGDWRALFKIKESKTKTVITFHILGTHTQLYGSLVH